MEHVSLFRKSTKGGRQKEKEKKKKKNRAVRNRRHLSTNQVMARSFLEPASSLSLGLFFGTAQAVKYGLIER